MHQEMALTSVATDTCTHDDVSLDADTSEHLIECNHCGRWWQCYGDAQDVWRDFVRFNRSDGSEPPTVNIVCSPKAWVPR